MDLLKELKTLLQAPSLLIEQEIQSLWSGYGQIIRCKSDKNGKQYVVKVVAPSNVGAHPRGWNTSIGHQRKLKSYQVEAHFYQKFAKQTDEYNKVPTLVASKSTAEYTLLVMEDLDDSGYFIRKDNADWQSLSIAIRWLAYFHVKFMDNNGTGLWPTGCYWHLATRQNELAAMPDNDFKRYAHNIDKVLSRAKFQTLVHGDAKFENLCFHHNAQKVAAVDFQYIGCGSGVKDLAYLVGSCLNESQLYQFDDLVVNEYLIHLKSALSHYQITLDFDALANETQQLYSVAWADFYRFLLGWNPQSWKICDYMKAKSVQGLEFVKLNLA